MGNQDNSVVTIEFNWIKLMPLSDTLSGYLPAIKPAFH